MATSRPLRGLLAASLALACVIVARGPQANARVATFSDVPRGFWAAEAIDYVAGDFDWMRDGPPGDDGASRFRPLRLESRGLFARALVRAFAPEEPVRDSVTFADLEPGEPFFAAVDVAVGLGWMRADPDGEFRPTDPVTTLETHEALVAAVGLGELADAASAIHLRGGMTIEGPDGFGAMLIGMRMGLRYDHPDDALDVSPTSPLPRAEVAWSLYRAATMPDRTVTSLARYAHIELPNLDPRRQAIVRWGIRYVGYPYVWGGEWSRPTTPGYCCGAQVVGGFDCSGLAWWLLRAGDAGWDNSPPRPYAGWRLPQRDSAAMAATGGHVSWGDLRAGDLLFYDGDGDGRVDHVNTFIGNGWAIDSSDSLGGVTLTWLGSGWYADHFVHGRRVIGPFGEVLSRSARP
jgi:NlpC/P60 family/S-layer homology domain